MDKEINMLVMKCHINPCCLCVSPAVLQPISSVLILNMDEDFENIVTKVVQMAHRVAQINKN